MSLRDFFNGCPTSVHLDKGFTIEWSLTGIGIGQFYFYTDPTDGKIHIDNECMSRDKIKQVLCEMVNQAILNDDREVKG